MKNVLLMSLSLALASMPISASTAQRSNTDESIAIMTAAAMYARNSYPNDGIVLIDVDSTMPSKTSWASAIAKRMTNARPGKANHVCSFNPHRCHLKGAGLALQIAAPTMRGDTAEVVVRTWRETSNNRQPVYSSESIVAVVRRGNEWVAAGGRIIWET